MVDLLYSDPMCRKLLLSETSTKKDGHSERLIFKNIKLVRLDEEFSESHFPSNIPTKPPKGLTQEQLNNFLVSQKEKMLDLLPTDRTQQNIGKTFQTENELQGKGLTGDLGSNTPWNQWVKKEFCQRVFKQNPPWRELDIKGEKMKMFGMESSMLIP